MTVPSGATTGNVVVNASGVNTNGVNFAEFFPRPQYPASHLTSGICLGPRLPLLVLTAVPSQGAGSVTFNGIAATVTSWGAGTIQATVPTTATTGNVVVNASGTNSNGVNFTVTKLPTGWSDGDIGAVRNRWKCNVRENGVFTINASGQSIWGASDQMHFAYQGLSGDGTIVARIVSLTGGVGPQAGVIIRETLNTGSTNAFTESNYSNINFAYRLTTAGAAT